MASYRRHGPMQVTGPHSARQTPSAKSMNRSAAHQSRPFTPVAPNCSQQACRITGPPTAKLPLCSCPKSASPPVCLCLCLYTPLPLQRPSPPLAAFPRFLLDFSQLLSDPPLRLSLTTPGSPLTDESSQVSKGPRHCAKSVLRTRTSGTRSHTDTNPTCIASLAAATVA